jgi:signal transduction histidine kinase
MIAETPRLTARNAMSHPMNGSARSELSSKNGDLFEWKAPELLFTSPCEAEPNFLPQQPGYCGLDEAALRERSVLLSFALEAARLGTWKLDLSSGLLAGCSRYNQIFKRTPENPLRHWDEWRACVHPEDRKQLDLVFETAIARNEGDFVAEYRVTGPDGLVRRVASSAQLLQGTQGTATSLIGTARIVEEPAPAGDRLRASELEREALERQLRQKDEFLATLSHELRCPLAPIRNALKLLQSLGVAEPLFVWARDLIERQILQMGRLLDDLLDLSRIAQGKTHLERRAVEVATIVAHAVETSQPLLDLRGQRLSLYLPPEPLQLYGDSLRLAQVFTNLLNNASKYSDEKDEIALRVEQGKGEVIFRVKDHGIGMSSETLPHIFDAFFQADPYCARSKTGLGVGLSLVKQLVSMHGGKVAAFSDGPGRGSEFVVRLPLAQAAFVEA